MKAKLKEETWVIVRNDRAEGALDTPGLGEFSSLFLTSRVVLGQNEVTVMVTSSW